MDCSDHASLILQTNALPDLKKHFRFESIWPCFDGFLDVVSEAWHCPLQNVDAFRTLDWKLRNTARALQRWSQKHVSSIRLQLAVARELILRFDSAQERRDLTQLELSFRRELKCKTLGLASLARSIARQ